MRRQLRQTDVSKVDIKRPFWWDSLSGPKMKGEIEAKRTHSLDCHLEAEITPCLISEAHNNPFGWKRPFACRPKEFLKLTYRPLLPPCKASLWGFWNKNLAAFVRQFATRVFPTHRSIKTWRDSANTWGLNLASVPTSKAGCDLAYVSIFTLKSTTTHARTCKTSRVAAVRKFACIYMRITWKNPLTCRSVAFNTVLPSSISDLPAF